jgi:hypothetical protein
MRQHGSKLEHANVVAGFASQSDAEVAILGLRIGGIPDDRIGYYARTHDGRLVDLLARRHRFAGAILGGVIGLLLGVGCGWLLSHPGAHNIKGLDPMGLMAVCGIIGALALGAAGGMAGLWTARPGAFAPAPPGATDPFVIAVDAGEYAEQARALIRRHGGHELRPLEAGHREGWAGQPA